MGQCNVKDLWNRPIKRHCCKELCKPLAHYLPVICFNFTVLWEIGPCRQCSRRHPFPYKRSLV